MSSIKKKLLVFALISALCASPSAAFADIANTTTEQATVQTETAQVFTIDKAIEYAKANSKTLASCKANENYQKYSVDESRLLFKNTKKAVNSKYSTGLSDINTSLVSNGFVYKSAKLSHRVAQRNTIQQEYILENNVSQVFYSYLANVKSVAISEENLKIAQNSANAAQIRYDGGMMSANDLESFNIQALEAQNALNNAIRAKDYSMLNLKTILNYPLDKELVVTGEFTRVPESTVTPEQAIEKAKNSITRANAEDTYALAKEKLRRYQGYYSSNQAAWHSAAAEFANAELSYQSALEQEILNIYSAYNNMKSLYETLETSDRQLANLENLMKAAKINYDSGLITADSYITAVNNYNNLKNAVAITELSAYAAVVSYELTFDCVNTIFEEDDPLL